MRIDSTEAVDGSGTSALSTMLTVPRVLRVATQQDVYIAIGSNVTAVTGSDALLPGGTVEYFRVGSNEQIGVIGGEIQISTMN